MKKRTADFTFDELEAWGHDGLMDAARRFDKSKGVGFMTFAQKRIVGAMLDGMMNFRPGKRSRKKLGNPTPSSIDSIGYDPEDGNRTPAEVAETKDQAEHLFSYLNNKMALVIRMRFWRNMTFKAIGLELNLCEARICQLYHQAITVLKYHACQ